MLSSGKRRLRVQKGFTLVELMTVLVILGIVLGIGAPKYLKIQSQAEWDADAAMIRSFAKAAEMYVIKADINLRAEEVGSDEIALSKLITEKVIDGTIVLNRINSADSDNASVKNTGNTAIKDLTNLASIKFVFDKDFGTVKNLEDLDTPENGIIIQLIGKPIYD